MRSRLERKVPPVIWGLMTLALMWSAVKQLPFFEFTHSQAGLWAFFWLISGLAIAFSGIRKFKKARTTVNPLSSEGTTGLVTGGFYRYSRNPMYLGLLMTLLGWFFHLRNLAALPFLVFFVTVMTELQIKPEERALEEMFGQPYREYLKSTPRWFGF